MHSYAQDPASVTEFGDLVITSRPLTAYQDMFALDDHAPGGLVLDCPGGASSFGAEARALGWEVVSVDPVYAQPGAELVARSYTDLERLAGWMKTNPHIFNWDYLGSPEAIAASWGRGIDIFSVDFVHDDVRYVAAALPELPFPDRHFTLTLSSFLLFAYADSISFEAHLASLRELVRVTSGEVRVFPLHDTQGRPYPDLDNLLAALREHGVETELRTARCSYKAEPGGDLMLVCRRAPQS